jgi:FMN phosphatase YigB (HAD superfamily)
VVIGDTYANDILPALTIGMKTVWVLHRPDKEKANITRVLNGLDPRPNLTLNSISELAAHHLEGLSGNPGNPWGSAY